MLCGGVFMDTSKKENKEIEMPDLGEQCSAHGPAEEEVCQGGKLHLGGALLLITVSWFSPLHLRSDTVSKVRICILFITKTFEAFPVFAGRFSLLLTINQPSRPFQSQQSCCGALIDDTGRQQT